MELLQGEKLYLSIVSEMELLGYAGISETEQRQIEDLLHSFEIVGIENSIRTETISVKKSTRLKLPDSIIAATSLVLGIPLISADKQFRTVESLSFIMYER